MACSKSCRSFPFVIPLFFLTHLVFRAFVWNLRYSHYDWYELDTPVVTVPLHALEGLEVGLIKAHVVRPGRRGPLAHDCIRVLCSYGLLPLDLWRACWEGAAHLVAPKHAPKAVASCSSSKKIVLVFSFQGVRDFVGTDLKSQTPSDGCMLVTIPLMWRVVSVHRLKTVTSPEPLRMMSCSTVSDVYAAISAVTCA